MPLARKTEDFGLRTFYPRGLPSKLTNMHGCVSRSLLLKISVFLFFSFHRKLAAAVAVNGAARKRWFIEVIYRGRLCRAHFVWRFFVTSNLPHDRPPYVATRRWWFMLRLLNVTARDTSGYVCAPWGSDIVGIFINRLREKPLIVQRLTANF